jgi:hypothetical protein
LQDGDLRVIRDGLAETDRIVIGGIQQVRAGSPVNPVDGAIQEEDVAHNSDASV